MKVLFLIGCAALLVLNVQIAAAQDDTLIIPYDVVIDDQEEIFVAVDEPEFVEFEALVAEPEAINVIQDDVDEKEEIVELTPEEKEAKEGIFFQICDEEPDDNYHPIHISHPADCTKFYKCYNGRGYLMTCPSDEHWSVRLDRCDYPKQAKCKLDGQYHYKFQNNAVAAAWNEDVELSEPDYMITDSRCAKNDDPYHPNHIAHPTDCSKFYKCFDGVGYKISCPPGLLFSFKLQRCDFARFTDCAIAETNHGQASLYNHHTSENNAVAAAWNEDVELSEPDYMITDSRCAKNDDPYHPNHIAHPLDCSKFYKCFDGVGYKISCPPGLLFSFQLQRCDFARFTDCAVPMMNHAEALLYEEEPMFGDRFLDERCPNKDDNDNPVHLLIEGYPEKFLKCSNGEAFVMDCPNNQHFSEAKNRCDKRAPTQRPINFPRQPVQVPQVPMLPPVLRPETRPQLPLNPVQIPMLPQLQVIKPQETPQAPPTQEIQQPPQLIQLPSWPVERPQEIPQQRPLPNFPQFLAPQQPIQLPSEEVQMPQFPVQRPQEIPQQRPVPNFPQFPAQQLPQQPIQIPSFPQFPVLIPMIPEEELPLMPQIPVQIPQELPNFPQAPSNKPQFPNWLPQLPQNPQGSEDVVLNPLPNLFKPRAPISATFEQDEGTLESRCPLNDDPWNPTHLGHPTDCKKFMKCFYGRAFTIDCPPGQEWYERFRRCDYASNAQCKK